jgi:phosphoribulokinase
MNTGRLNFIRTIASSDCIFIIGVAGDSGSGKTTFTRALREIFGDRLVSSITMDDYHTLDRAARAREGITPLHPAANDTALLERHLAELKAGRSIEKPVYNHETGTIEGPVTFSPTKIIIIEGLHPLSTPGLRRHLDVTLFVDPVDEVKYAWKIRRDVGDRGYHRDDVLAEIAARKPDYEAYVAPQKQYADAILRVAPSAYDPKGQRGLYAVTLMQEQFDHTVRNITLPLDLFAMTSLAQRDFAIAFRAERLYGRKMGAVTFDGEFRYEVVRRLEEAVEEQTGVHPIRIFEGREYVTATEAVSLILAWRIINRRIFIEETGPGCRR